MAIPILVKDTKTGEEYHVASIQAAAKMTGASAYKLYQAFYSGLITVKDGHWTYKEDHSDLADHSSPHCKPVIRTDTQTGEEVYFKSIRASADASFVSESTIYGQVKGCARATRTGYTWRYADNAQEGA